jgi:hypothetical protein
MRRPQQNGRRHRICPKGTTKRRAAEFDGVSAGIGCDTGGAMPVAATAPPSVLPSRGLVVGAQDIVQCTEPSAGMHNARLVGLRV